MRLNIQYPGKPPHGLVFNVSVFDNLKLPRLLKIYMFKKIVDL